MVKRLSFFFCLFLKVGLGYVRNERANSMESSLHKHFIEFVVVETKYIVSSHSNVILILQSCGQHSGMALAGILHGQGEQAPPRPDIWV